MQANHAPEQLRLHAEGQFEQCDKFYDAGLCLQCAQTTAAIRKIRNYCAEHKPKEGKAELLFGGRREVQK